MFNIKFENLGNICKGNIQMNKMLIFTGENNSGKTYATYTLYDLLDKPFQYELSSTHSILDELYKIGKYEINLKVFFDKNFLKMKGKIEKSISNGLPYFFSANVSDFEKSKIEIDLDVPKLKNDLIKHSLTQSISIGKKDTIVFEAVKKSKSEILQLILLDNEIPKRIINDALKDILCRLVFKDLFSNSFLLPAERTGINLFYQELSSTRTAILHHFKKQEIDKRELIKDLIISRYPVPIADYIDFLNTINILKKSISPYKDIALEIQKSIIKGKYLVEKDGIYFSPYKNNSNKQNYNNKIPLHLTSSTVKTFFSLVFYLEHIAKKHDTLIIDEPELNLHPDNQRIIARILAIIVNRNINVVVSTHSDYFIREINNLIMLNEDFKSKDEIMKKYNYSENMTISTSQINAYLFEKNTIEPMEINKKEGIIAETFDNVINQLNEASDVIYYQKEADIKNARVI